MTRSSGAELLRFYNRELNATDLENLSAACSAGGLETGGDYRLAFGGLDANSLEKEVDSFLVEIGFQAPSNSALLVAVAKHCALEILEGAHP